MPRALTLAWFSLSVTGAYRAASTPCRTVTTSSGQHVTAASSSCRSKASHRPTRWRFRPEAPEHRRSPCSRTLTIALRERFKEPHRLTCSWSTRQRHGRALAHPRRHRLGDRPNQQRSVPLGDRRSIAPRPVCRAFLQRGRVELGRCTTPSQNPRRWAPGPSALNAGGINRGPGGPASRLIERCRRGRLRRP